MPTIMPAFEKYPSESTIVGRLLAGYGELEFDLCQCLQSALGDREMGLRVMFRRQGEENRIQIADALMRYKYEDLGLRDPYCQGIGAMSFCKQLRNQYAHCHWLDDPVKGLVFASFEESAKSNARPMMITPHRVDLKILTLHEEYFLFTQKYLWYLASEYGRLVGRIASHEHSIPPAIDRPPRYNAKA